MPYQIFPHTADVRLKVWGATLEQVFRDALIGMTALQKKDIPVPPQYTERALTLQAQDPTSLLVDFLNEVLACTAIHKELYPHLIVEEMDNTSLKVRLHGVSAQEFDKDIKAVTYHEAHLIQNEKGEWETTLVFDI